MEHQFAYTSNIKLYYSIYSISNYATAFLMMELLPTCNVNELHAAQNDHKMHQCHISLSQLPIAMEHQFAYTSNIKLYYSIYSISNNATAFLMIELLPTCTVNELQAAQNDHKMHQCHISLSQVPIAMEHQFACTSNIKVYNSIYSISKSCLALLERLANVCNAFIYL